MILQLSSRDVMRLTTDGEIAISGGAVVVKLSLDMGDSCVIGEVSHPAANAPKTDNFWMRAKYDGRCFECRTPIAQGRSLYRDFSGEKPRSMCRSCGERRESELRTAVAV